MRYGMVIFNRPDLDAELSSAVLESAMRDTYAWFEKWGAAGKVADGGAELEHPRTARTVRGGPDGAPIVTDGPFLELKEVIGGLVILEASDLDDAMGVAATWPGLAYRGVIVEVRPLVEH